jgi:hypothetical protein
LATVDCDGDGIDNATECDNGTDPTDPCSPNQCDALIAAKVFLGGPYVNLEGLMHDSLRVNGIIPLSQPYDVLTDFGYMGTESVDPTVFNVTGSDAIVDWIFVELRDMADPTLVLHQRAGLVQRDGDIVDVDGTSPLSFEGATEESYYISVRHRNHLGVMSASPITFMPMGTNIDFTQTTTSNYQLIGSNGSAFAQQSWVNGMTTTLTLWPGNMSNTMLGGVHSGDRIIYQGGGSDGDEAYFKILLDPGNTNFLPNYIVADYHRGDANMDAKVIYQGGSADTDLIFFTVVLFPGNSDNLPNYVIFEQIPN